MAICQKCGTQNAAGMMFCSGCGNMIGGPDQQPAAAVSPPFQTPAAAAGKTVVCQTCGAINGGTELLCNSCGMPVFSEEMPAAQGVPQQNVFPGEEKSIYCSTCGAPNKQGVNFCAGCGNGLVAPANPAAPVPRQPAAAPPPARQQYPPPPPLPGGNYQYQNYGAAQQKSKVVAGLLSIFLGFFGAGRFYLGYTGLGIAQLIVSVATGGIGALWGVIDGILILTGSVKTDAKNVPLKD